MAGDWIPMRLDLAEDPAVMSIADQLGCTEEEVVGRLHKIWSWASRQCHGGRVTNVTLVSLGRVTNLRGFPELMRDEGWLEETEDEAGRPQIEFPKWENWLGESAKKRLSDAKRQRKRRSKSNHASVTKMSRSKRDKSVTTGQESTGQESNNTHTHTDPLWREEWERWVESWEGRCGRRFDQIQADVQLQQLGRMSPEKAKRDLQFSLEKYSRSILDSDHDFQKRSIKTTGKRAPSKEELGF